jgi:hypothetical protein
LRVQPGRRAFGAGCDGGGVRARPRLGDRDRTGALAAHGGKQPTLTLLGVAFEEHLVDVAEGPPDEDVLAVAELLFDEHGLNGRQPAAAELLRNVHRVEAEITGLLEDRPGRGGVEGAGRLDVVLERDQLVVDETTDRLDEHPLLVGEREVHGCRPGGGGEKITN